MPKRRAETEQPGRTRDVEEIAVARGCVALDILACVWPLGVLVYVLPARRRPFDPWLRSGAEDTSIPRRPNPRADIAAALAQAKREHKRVILDFGGDWCGDCQVLDIYFHQAPNAELLAEELRAGACLDRPYGHEPGVSAKYGVPINKGVPALAVLDADGKVIYAHDGRVRRHAPYGARFGD